MRNNNRHSNCGSLSLLSIIMLAISSAFRRRTGVANAFIAHAAKTCRRPPRCLRQSSALSYRVGPDVNPRNATSSSPHLPNVVLPEIIIKPPPPKSQSNAFEVTSPYLPTGDQPQAIAKLVSQIERGDRYNILRGITGTGKTYVMAQTIAKLKNRPALVLCHNKTLAAQLARELRSLLRKNHVHLFVSYYNHYVPESYNEKNGKYISKKSAISDELNALRHLATRALVQHSDVVIVASISCIYGLGLPSDYLDAAFTWQAGGESLHSEDEIIALLEGGMYVSATKKEEEDDGELLAHGDVLQGEYLLTNSPDGKTLSVMVWPPTEPSSVQVRFKCMDSDQYAVSSVHSMQKSEQPTSMQSITIFPARHHTIPSEERFEESLSRIQDELSDRLKELRDESKFEEANRLSIRVSQDLMLLRETGTCNGIENYSRHLALREEGAPPETLLDYFGSQNFLLLVDESHVTLPQLAAMYRGDRARKKMLVKGGYRLPSALDNRPLKEDEFWKRVTQTVFVSATPARREVDLLSQIPQNEQIDMVIRPTFVPDPPIVVRPTSNQLNDLVEEVKRRTEKKERSLALALTKKDAEDLSTYLNGQGVSSTYIHSGLKTKERSNALQSLQVGDVDCLVGVNLLREGIDLPEVSLVAILNADVEGFLRSETALLQTIGRAARNRNGSAILYANRITDSMKRCIELTEKRRVMQLEYNVANQKEVKTTKGSSFAPIFELLKDEIELETEGADEIPNAKRKRPAVTAVDGDVDLANLPKCPGVYFWKDADGTILYIGKAKCLRSRVRSYLVPSANHGSRISAMLKKKKTIEYIITPSERDALLLEANLITHHKPPYNVMLKEDESYPYICATIGDEYPEFRLVPRRQMGRNTEEYKYFGPYPKFSDISTILEGVEATYRLRSLRFQARFGEASKEDYISQFNQALLEVFEEEGTRHTPLFDARKEGEEASIIFESDINQSRDVVVVAESGGEAPTEQVLVSVLQLRQGLVTGQFFYTHQFDDDETGGCNLLDAITSVLTQRHYPSGEGPIKPGYSFFPDEVLVQHKLSNLKGVKDAIKTNRDLAEPNRTGSKVSVRKPASRGPRSKIDERVVNFALDNAKHAAQQKEFRSYQDAVSTSVDGTAARQLQSLLSLESSPERIECFDISHLQGEAAVGSRVVFDNGRPAPHLYRRFNIKNNVADRRDDYANLEEVLERRFLRARSNISSSGLVEKDDPWSMPDVVVIDGGKGQLSAALRGMAKAGVFSSNMYSTDCSYDVIMEEDASRLELQKKTNSGFSPVCVPVVALAKREEEVFQPQQSDPINGGNADSPAMLLLRALRDESHRFAVASHRKLHKRRNKQLVDLVQSLRRVGNETTSPIPTQHDMKYKSLAG